MVPSTANTRTITRNSFWYGLEMVAGTIAVFGISIPMARVLGPQKIGYFNYIGWLTAITGVVGSAGIPLMTQKYMAEYLGKGETGIVRTIYTSTLRLQVMIAAAMTALGVLALLLFGDPAHRTVSLLQVLSVFPGMVSFIPAQSNVAREDMRANVISALTGTGIHLAAVVVSLLMGWDLVGIACGIVAARCVEAGRGVASTPRGMEPPPHAQPPPGVEEGKVSLSGHNPREAPPPD